MPFQASQAGSTAGKGRFRGQVEADYQLQVQVRTADSGAKGAVSVKVDAAGGCDGIITGQWGFHTGLDDRPWWQVDLGRGQDIVRAAIWNRCDNNSAARAKNLLIRLSDDAKTWRTVYRHDGTVFYGHKDGKPLIISVPRQKARYVRIELGGKGFLHLDEVEIFGPDNAIRNLARGKPATQSSTSKWSSGSQAAEADIAVLDDIELGKRWAGRRELLSDPLLDFDAILFTKRVPGSFTHMSDQYLGWWSRPGGGIYILRDFKTDSPRVECISGAFKEEGNFLRPTLSYDAKKVLFAWCKYYPEVAGIENKLDKSKIPEDSFYHLFEMNIDGSGVRQLTGGKYNDFDGRYLPDGRVVFLSTRRNQAIQVGRESAAMTLVDDEMPEVYVRCGGGASRPCAVYTLHTIDAGGGNLTAISPFEMFEWTPSIASDGTILYSRWDYVDRDNMPFMSLWSMHPDGTNARIVYGNFTRSPHCTFEPRSIPNSPRIVFTATGHHSHTIGSLVLLDPTQGSEGNDPVTRLTPEVAFPEIEGWPKAFYANPWPLSERLYLVSWGPEPDPKQGKMRSENGMGIYVYDSSGQLELLYRDPDISSMYPIPLRWQKKPPTIPSTVDWQGRQEGRFFVSDVYRGLRTVKRGDIKALRIIAIPPKTHPTMNSPVLGLTRDDPGKCVLGTVPVEADGSAYFRVPSGVIVFFQALDAEGKAVQTMRSATYAQPGQTVGCIGCHESRQDAPPPKDLVALRREPSMIKPAPVGSWPLRFDKLVQPVLDRRCVSCHDPKGDVRQAGEFDLTADKAYDSLIHFGKPSIYDHVMARYKEGISQEGACVAGQSQLLAKIATGDEHADIELDAEDLERLITWMDTYAQRLGSFSDAQEQELLDLRKKYAYLLDAE